MTRYKEKNVNMIAFFACTYILTASNIVWEGISKLIPVTLEGLEKQIKEEVK